MESSIDLGLPVTKDTNPSNNSSQNSIKSTEKPIGRRVSGKPWKYQKTATRRSQLPKVLRKSWTERMKEKNERIAVKLLENELKDKVESEKKRLATMSNFNFNGNNNNKNYANNTTMKDNHPSYSNNISTYYTINNNALTDSNDNYNGNFTGAYHHNYRGGKFNDSVSIGIAHPPSPGAPNYQNNILRKNLLKEFPLNKYTVDEVNNYITNIIKCLQTGQYECKICYKSIIFYQKTWTCQLCCTIFHLDCIKNLASKQIMETYYYGEIFWKCPGCDISSKSFPDSYQCFCGKTRNPLSKKNTTPHGCGKLCGKKCDNNSCSYACQQIKFNEICPEAAENSGQIILCNKACGDQNIYNVKKSVAIIIVRDPVIKVIVDRVKKYPISHLSANAVV
ncbi:12281_t:CDS:2 [Entrophospora sp. SA101]|nr:12281_t:CDS:2 [Entrophospora sp. SA101]